MGVGMESERVNGVGNFAGVFEVSVVRCSASGRTFLLKWISVQRKII